MARERARDLSGKMLAHRPWLAIVAFLLIGGAQFALWRLLLRPEPAYCEFRLPRVVTEATSAAFSEWVTGRRLADALSLDSVRSLLLLLAELPVLVGILVVGGLSPLLCRAPRRRPGDICFFYGGFLGASCLWSLPALCPEFLMKLTSPGAVESGDGSLVPVFVDLIIHVAEARASLWASGALTLAALACLLLSLEVYRLDFSDASSEKAA